MKTHNERVEKVVAVAAQPALPGGSRVPQLRAAHSLIHLFPNSLIANCALMVSHQIQAILTLSSLIEPKNRKKPWAARTDQRLKTNPHRSPGFGEALPARRIIPRSLSPPPCPQARDRDERATQRRWREVREIALPALRPRPLRRSSPQLRGCAE